MRRRDYIAHLFADARLVEVRHHARDRWVSGTFSDPQALRDTVRALADSGNLYTTLNAPHPTVEATNAMTARALHDSEIATVVRLPFDFDPVRPAGTASTDDELAAARRQRDRLVAMLSGLGWPIAAVASSGNGAHAMYRCRLPADDATRDMLAALYRGLARDFSAGAVAFDPTVRNPSRIWRLYGTMNRKGVPTMDRPHRTAIVVIPHRWEGVSPRQVEALANRYARRPAPRAEAKVVAVIGAGDYGTLDVVSWFTTHDAYKRPLGSGKHAAACPWQGEHTTESTPTSTDTVIWEADGGGWPTFHCSHAHCDGRNITDVMRLWGDADRFCARPFTRRAA